MIFSTKQLSTLRSNLVNNLTKAPSTFNAQLRTELFYRRCILCDAKTDSFVCSPCEKDLIGEKHRCDICQISLTNAHQNRCPECLKKPPSYDKCYAVCDYSFPADEIVHGLKYGGKRYLAEFIGHLICRHIDLFDGELPQLLLPIPMSDIRTKKRGFNQSALIAKQCSKLTNIPFNHTSLLRKSDIQAQAGSSRLDRLKNIKGSMIFEPAKAQNANHIALIDDVMTTGATINEACRALRAQGVKRIDVWIFARTPKPETTTST